MEGCFFINRFQKNSTPSHFPTISLLPSILFGLLRHFSVHRFYLQLVLKVQQNTLVMLWLNCIFVYKVDYEKRLKSRQLQMIPSGAGSTSTGSIPWSKKDQASSSPDDGSKERGAPFTFAMQRIVAHKKKTFMMLIWYDF